VARSDGRRDAGARRDLQPTTGTVLGRLRGARTTRRLPCAAADDTVGRLSDLEETTFMRPVRAGDTMEDVCRACKLDRLHTVIAADRGLPIRVQCDYCGSQHQYRGGPSAPSSRGEDPGRRRSGPPAGGGSVTPREPLALVSDRERLAEPVMTDFLRDSRSPEAPDHAPVDLELLLRRIIREEAGITPVVPAEKWRGGTVVLKPGNPSLQEKSWPIETIFHKIVMIRNRLRTLEQHVNASDLPEDAKIKLQTYITGCYGSLTSFNVLFAHEEDQFRGASDNDR
jgi:hypothetical protein